MKNAELLNNVLNVMVRYAKWFILVAVVAVLCSGIIFVQPDEVAIIVRLGKVVGDTPAEMIKQPGLHFAFPYVIDRVIKVPVGKVKEMAISTLYSPGELAYTTEYYGVGKYSNTLYSYGGDVGDMATTGYAITGDDNIILIDGQIQNQGCSQLCFKYREPGQDHRGNSDRCSCKMYKELERGLSAHRQEGYACRAGDQRITGYIR